MADETKAMSDIAAILQQLMDERKETAAGWKQWRTSNDEYLTRLRSGSGSLLEDSQKRREDLDERMRRNQELTAQRHDEQKQLLQAVLAELKRHNDAMERHNELIVRLLERSSR